MKIVKVRIDADDKVIKKYWNSIQSLVRKYSKPVKIDNWSIQVFLDLKKRGDEVASYVISSNKKLPASSVSDIRQYVEQITRDINKSIDDIEKVYGYRVEPLRG